MSRLLSPLRAGALALGLVLGIAAGASAEPSLRVTARAPKLLLPAVTGTALETGRVDTGSLHGAYAVTVDVDAPPGDGGWVLSLRADAGAFRPADAAKPVTDLLWKLEGEGADDYRPLDEREWVVVDRPEGGPATVVVDFAVLVGWDTPPRLYTAGLVFTVRPR